MKTLELIQGSPEWHAHRAAARNASDAPAMMGASPYVTRNQLIARRATGIVPEVDAATQRRFDAGHAVEPALRALAEQLVGDDLYPVVGISDDGYLSASFDGVSMDERVFCELKLSNAEKMRLIADGEIPPQDYWQIVQQFAVCESAQRCIYIVGDGTMDRSAWLLIESSQVEDDIGKLRAAWDQLDADVAAYVAPKTPAPTPVAQVEGFGALSLRVEGRVLASNLDTFKRDADAFIARLPKPADLQSDEDFAHADAAVKACAEAETRIKAAVDSALAQMADVDAVLRTADAVAESIRAARLALDKVVKAEKESRRAELVRRGVEAVRLHYNSINATMAGYELGMPASVSADLAAAIKGLKSLASISDKIDLAVSQFKIAANQEEMRRRYGIALVEEHAAHRHLLPDAARLVAEKSVDDLRNLITARIADYQAKEAARIAAEAERMAAEKQRAEAERMAEAAPTPAKVIDFASAPSQPASFINLTGINQLIAPLTITAVGLSQLGIEPVANEKASKLYDTAVLPSIYAALIRHLNNVSRTAKAA